MTARSPTPAPDISSPWGPPRAIHRNDMTTYTRLAWYMNGKADGDRRELVPRTDLSARRRCKSARPKAFYREKINGADWAGDDQPGFYNRSPHAAGREDKRTFRAAFRYQAG